MNTYKRHRFPADIIGPNASQHVLFVAGIYGRNLGTHGFSNLNPKGADTRTGAIDR
jgi:hypothetical protein